MRETGLFYVAATAQRPAVAVAADLAGAGYLRKEAFSGTLFALQKTVVSVA
jgi:hypothetical protein